MKGKYTYQKVWHIEYDPKPIHYRGADWNWWHEDYDGAPESPEERTRDIRCGTSGSVDDAIVAIEECETELMEQEGSTK